MLIITLDTTRPDHLGVYGYDYPTSPEMDEFAKKSFVFDNAFTVISHTSSSHASIFTGLYPKTHGGLNNNWIMNESLVFISEILKEKGYLTAGFPACFVVDHNRNFDQGYDYFSKKYNDPDYGFRRDADYVFEDFQQWWENKSDDAFFAWVHFYDPHRDYNAPKEYSDMFPSRLVTTTDSSDAWDLAGYDGEIAYMDHYVGRILDLIEESGKMNETIVVIVGDHGEGLGNHNYLEHSEYIYREQMMVPLMISIPKFSERIQRIDDNVETIDLMPTLIDILGINTTNKMQGRSLVPVFRDERLPEKFIFGETRVTGKELYSPNRHTRLSISGFGWKYIFNNEISKKKNGTDELFNLDQDPYEEKNLIDSDDPEIIKKKAYLLSKLMIWDKDARPYSQGYDVNAETRKIIEDKKEKNQDYSAEKKEIDAIEKALRDLGYMS